MVINRGKRAGLIEMALYLRFLRQTKCKMANAIAALGVRFPYPDHLGAANQLVAPFCCSNCIIGSCLFLSVDPGIHSQDSVLCSDKKINVVTMW